MTTTPLLDPRKAMDGAREKPQILSVRTAARSRLFHIESVQLKFANGNRREFERIANYIEMNPVSAGVALTPEDFIWSSGRRIANPPQVINLPHIGPT